MPHHWRPADGDEPAKEEKKLKYRGKDMNGETWELWEIANDEAKDIEGKPKKHHASGSCVEALAEARPALLRGRIGEPQMFLNVVVNSRC